MNEAKTALVISFHDWKTHRMAGFHQIGRALLENGFNVGFAAHSRPLYAALLKRQGVNRPRNWLALMRGIRYPHKDTQLLNFTALDLQLPGPLRKGRLRRLNQWLAALANRALARKCRRLFPKPDCIIIESGTSVSAFAALKKAYPCVPIIYRPSDPVIGGLNPPAELIAAEKQLVAQADLVLLVNEEGKKLYLANGYQLDEKRTRMLPNGIDVESFGRSYPCPVALEKQPSACYVGGHPPNWAALLAVTQASPQLNLVVVCPEPMPTAMQAKFANCNLTYIEGVPPEEVPAYLTNTSVILVPYAEGWAERPLGMHGKIMQAMCAGKPIVALNVDASLGEYGIIVSKDADSFGKDVKAALHGNPAPAYAFDFHARDWSHFRKRFISQITA